MAIDRRTFLAASAAAVAARSLHAQSPLPDSSPGVTIYARPRDYSEDMQQYLARQIAERREQRRKLVAAVATPEQAEQRARDIRAKVWELLGGQFEKTPLNPRIVGRIEREGYRIDRLIYESRPKLYVTANLYVPSGAGPFPAILSPLGHSENGKAYSSYQRLFHTLARKGYVVLAYDPFGQGERIEYPGAVPGNSALGGPTQEHDYAGKRLLLLGQNFALYRAWDGIRGIDYLLTRADVDPKRIGCGGQSGGGTMTMYLAAIDERIAAAIVSEGNTENVSQPGFEAPGAVDDAEQNLVPSLVYGLDRFDLLHAFAPRPLLITVANKDAGTTYGPEYINDALALLAELKQTYRLLGAEDRVSLAETPMDHGYQYEHRRASYGWYNRWLNGGRGDNRETPVRLEPDEKLWCTTSGFVGSLHGESSFTYTRAQSKITRPKRPLTAEIMRDVLGIPGNYRQLRNGGPRLLSITEKFDHAIEEFDVPSEAEIHVPLWAVRPLKGSGKLPAVLVFSDRGIEDFIGDDGMPADFTRAGWVFACADVRSRGACEMRPPRHGPRYYGYRHEDYLIFDTLMLGRPMLGGYVTDMLSAFDAVAARPDVDASRLFLIGVGTMGVAALLAHALEPRLTGAVVQGGLTNYRAIVENDKYTTPFRIFAPGVLHHFDLPDVAALAADRPLLLLNPIIADGRSVFDSPDAAGSIAADYPRAGIRTAEPVTAHTYLDWLNQPRKP